MSEKIRLTFYSRGPCGLARWLSPKGAMREKQSAAGISSAPIDQDAMNKGNNRCST